MSNKNVDENISSLTLAVVVFGLIAVCSEYITLCIISERSSLSRVKALCHPNNPYRSADSVLRRKPAKWLY